MNNDLAVTLHFRQLHAKQRLFVKSPLKRKVVCAGRRGGKTVACAYLAAKSFIEGKRVVYATPTADQAETFFFEVCRIFEEAIALGIVRKNASERFLERPGTQTRIRARTAWNADMLRGQFADNLILDEFQLADETVYSEVGLPMLLDSGGTVALIFTPASIRSRSVSKARDRQHAAKLFEKAKEDPRWLCLHWTSKENPFLAPGALEEVARDMSTLAFRQEVLAENVTEIPGALWSRELLERTRVSEIPTVIKRILIGVDPSGSSTTEAGIIAAGIGEDGHVYIIADHSLKAATPMAWAAKAVAAFHSLSADRIVGERNFGGDMVESTIRSVDPDVAYKDVVSSRGKVIRAEPVCALFEQGRAHLAGEFPALEDELVSYVAGDTRSPNRMDACCICVNALTGERLGVLDWYKSKAEKIERHAMPASTSRVIKPPDPVTVKEREAWTSAEFDRLLRRR